MPPIEFRDPELLWLAFFAIPVFWWANKKTGRLTFSSFEWLSTSTKSLKLRLMWLPAAALALSSISFAVALAGPRIGDQTSRILKKGIAIMMAIDLSSSMSALDLSEGDKEITRLDAVKKVFLTFVHGGKETQGRENDAIGLVTFARFADARSPLTLDHRNLTMIAEDLEIVTDKNEDGTAIGDGLGLAVQRLKESPARSKVMILLTDGVNNVGDLTPLQASQLAEALGIRIYAVGAGTDGMAPVRVKNPFTGRMVIRSMQVEIDEKSLREIADRTGGKYFRAKDAEGLKNIFAEIDQLERTQISEIRYQRYHEYFEEFTASGLGLAALGWLFGLTWFRRLP